MFNLFYTLVLRNGERHRMGSTAGMMLEQNALSTAHPTSRPNLLSGAITVASILMFIGTGSSVLSQSLQNYLGYGDPADRMLVIALLLNVALILFGWRRHSTLAEEVRQRAESEQRAQALASRDPLTGFLNRRSLAEEGASMLARAARRGKAMALLLLDLDHFKAINDMHGHAVGDAILRAVSAEVSSMMPTVALTARLGGDEFACAFPFDPKDPEFVDRIADRIVTRMSQPFEAEGLHLHVSFSLGIARSDHVSANIDALLRSADIAMYDAKKSGRSRYAWFDTTMEQELKLRNEIEIGLRTAIPNGEIVPYFEQQIDLATGRLHGFEILARWKHPTLGTVLPEQFIPIAEATGMIGELSLSVLRQALYAARDWDPSLVIAVNLSPWQLRDAWLAQKIIKTLTETGFPANRLEVEITEASLFDNLALAQSIIGSLKNQGVSLTLDDFGTGFSSLSHLRALPFDRIKIDRSFVLTLRENPDSAAIVNAIIGLGASLNIPITAEGVAAVEIEDHLRALGCSKAQGYLYGLPLPIPHVRRLLAERRLIVEPRRTVDGATLEAIPGGGPRKGRRAG